MSPLLYNSCRTNEQKYYYCPLPPLCNGDNEKYAVKSDHAGKQCCCFKKKTRIINETWCIDRNYLFVTECVIKNVLYWWFQCINEKRKKNKNLLNTEHDCLQHAYFFQYFFQWQKDHNLMLKKILNI